jgi:hypothetical protein
VAGRRPCAPSVLARTRSLCGRSASRSRCRGRGGRARSCARSRRRHLRRHRADPREGGHGDDSGWLSRLALASRLDRGGEGRRGGRGGCRRRCRRQRLPGMESSIRPPRHPHLARRRRLRRPDDAAPAPRRAATACAGGVPAASSPRPVASDPAGIGGSGRGEAVTIRRGVTSAGDPVDADATTNGGVDARRGCDRSVGDRSRAAAGRDVYVSSCVSTYADSCSCSARAGCGSCGCARGRCGHDCSTLQPEESTGDDRVRGSGRRKAGRRRAGNGSQAPR